MDKMSMKYTILSRKDYFELCNQIEYLKLKEYLLKNKWEQYESKIDGIVIFRLLNKENMEEIIVPSKRIFSDYGRVIADAIDTLAITKERHPIYIINEII
jgi:hypothetical protein